MRLDPDKLARDAAEQARSANRFREPDGWEKDARDEAKALEKEAHHMGQKAVRPAAREGASGVSDHAIDAIGLLVQSQHAIGHEQGVLAERNRILAQIDAALLVCCLDGGSHEDRSRAGALCAIRRAVEGGK